jgi:hypothetical protein
VNKKQRRIAILIMMTMPVLLAWFFVWLDYYTENLVYLLYAMMPYLFFDALNRDKSIEIDYLLLPASTAEKMIARIFQSIAIPTMMWSITIPAAILTQGVINLRAGETMLSYMPVLELLTVNNLLVGLFLQTVFGFASLTFRKQTMLKGFIIILPFLFIIISINVLLNQEGLMDGIIAVLFNIILLCLTILGWKINYNKLKKREIN